MRRLGVTQNTTRFLVKRPSWFVELRLTPGQGAEFFILLAMLCSGASVSAATVSAYETEQLYHAGKFEECREIAADQVRKGVWNELWPELLMRCHHTLGEYEAAVDVFESNLGRFGNRLAFRMAGVQAYRLVNRADKAKTQEETIFKMVQSAPWRFSSVRDQVNLGRFLATQGEDARQILEVLYDRVRRQYPKFVDVYLATAELALEKHDQALATEQLQLAAELQSSDPHIFYLLARSYRDSDDAAATAALVRALELNPRHVPSLLLQVDQAIDSELYDRAASLLTRILEINLRHPQAWAYHAVLAHLAGNESGERALRDAAISIWRHNPEVDHLIGKKLSQKYRFHESVAYQRISLKLRPGYLPARFQLAQDLLRIGEESEGWRLASQVQQEDPYHVQAFNLAELKDQLDRYRELRTDHFVVRMEPREAAIYGRQVSEFLEEAHDYLTEKYDVQLDQAVHVEIFPRQQDFAIRTFGLPGGAGYLGVCFGPLITANSPAAQGASPTNWQSVLWHEFCHVVTLAKTRNRMPRWLSEGISVYEERLRDRGWGQSMTPEFRQMVLTELTPVSRLSGAFLRPKSGAHLQFAYFESSLVVEYLLQSLGHETLLLVLNDLSAGMPINRSLERYTGSIHLLDQEFAEYARRLAFDFGNGLEWQVDLYDESMAAEERERLRSEHAFHYWLTLEAADVAAKQQDWVKVCQLLEPLNRLHPVDATQNGMIRRLANAYQELNDEAAETDILKALVASDGSAADACRRLVELGQKNQAWGQVHQYAKQMLAINPLSRSAQQAFVEASLARNEFHDVIDGRIALLEMDPADPAAAHFELAQAMVEVERFDEARRHVLMALEEAPRYRAAHRLLLDLTSLGTPANADSDEESAGGSATP